MKNPLNRSCVCIIALLIFCFFAETSAGLKSELKKRTDEVRVVYRQGVRTQTDSTTVVVRFSREARPDSIMPWKAVGGDSRGLDTLTVYLRNDTVSSAIFELSALSGDWTLRTELYFRGNGSVAFAFDNLRTFHGDVNAEKRIYSDSSGKVFSEKRVAYDLKTGKVTHRDYRDKSGPRYRTADLLKKELGSTWPSQKR